MQHVIPKNFFFLIYGVIKKRKRNPYVVKHKMKQ